MRVLITGVAGQDGTILSHTLSQEGAEIIGLVKPGHEPEDLDRLRRYAPNIQVIECELSDQDALKDIVVDSQPDKIFNFGGISSIVESIHNPELTFAVNVGAVEAILAGMRVLKSQGKSPRLVAAASGTIFEGVDRSPQTEDTEISPNSPYAQSKAQVIKMLRVARATEGLFTTSAILYNHESPLRGEGFVTRKISMAVAKIAAGQQEILELGNIEVARDWGWAPDYVNAMRLMLAYDTPQDFVLATGISHRLSYFVQKAFSAVGIKDWQERVVSTEVNQRKIDTNLLVGDSRSAYIELGWRHTVDFDSMAAAMVTFDQKLLADPGALWNESFLGEPTKFSTVN
jgi:GDPmannose 4,6-dehydratase